MFILKLFSLNMWVNFTRDNANVQSFTYEFQSTRASLPIHLSQWQYWFWFWFITLWVLYFMIILKNVQRKTDNYNVTINTSLRGHGKWGDFLVALIPLAWCWSILSNSNHMLRLVEWQSEGSLFTVRIVGSQWWWSYFFSANTDFNLKNYYINIGNNNWVLKSSPGGEFTQFWGARWRRWASMQRLQDRENAFLKRKLESTLNKTRSLLPANQQIDANNTVNTIALPIKLLEFELFGFDTLYLDYCQKFMVDMYNLNNSVTYTPTQNNHLQSTVARAPYVEFYNDLQVTVAADCADKDPKFSELFNRGALGFKSYLDDDVDIYSSVNAETLSFSNLYYNNLYFKNFDYNSISSIREAFIIYSKRMHKNCYAGNISFMPDITTSVDSNNIFGLSVDSDSPAVSNMIAGYMRGVYSNAIDLSTVEPELNSVSSLHDYITLREIDNTSSIPTTNNATVSVFASADIIATPVNNNSINVDTSTGVTPFNIISLNDLNIPFDIASVSNVGKAFNFNTTDEASLISTPVNIIEGTIAADNSAAPIVTNVTPVDIIVDTPADVHIVTNAPVNIVSDGIVGDISTAFIVVDNTPIDTIVDTFAEAYIVAITPLNIIADTTAGDISVGSIVANTTPIDVSANILAQTPFVIDTIPVNTVENSIAAIHHYGVTGNTDIFVDIVADTIIVSDIISSSSSVSAIITNSGSTLATTTKSPTTPQTGYTFIENTFADTISGVNTLKTTTSGINNNPTIGLESSPLVQSTVVVIPDVVDAVSSVTTDAGFNIVENIAVGTVPNTIGNSVTTLNTDIGVKNSLANFSVIDDACEITNSTSSPVEAIHIASNSAFVLYLYLYTTLDKFLFLMSNLWFVFYWNFYSLLAKFSTVSSNLLLMSYLNFYLTLDKLLFIGSNSLFAVYWNFYLLLGKSWFTSSNPLFMLYWNFYLTLYKFLLISSNPLFTPYWNFYLTLDKFLPTSSNPLFTFYWNFYLTLAKFLVISSNSLFTFYWNFYLTLAKFLAISSNLLFTLYWNFYLTSDKFLFMCHNRLFMFYWNLYSIIGVRYSSTWLCTVSRSTDIYASGLICHCLESVSTDNSADVVDSNAGHMLINHIISDILSSKFTSIDFSSFDIYKSPIEDISLVGSPAVTLDAYLANNTISFLNFLEIKENYDFSVGKTSYATNLSDTHYAMRYTPLTVTLPVRLIKSTIVDTDLLVGKSPNSLLYKPGCLFKGKYNKTINRLDTLKDDTWLVSKYKDIPVSSAPRFWGIVQQRLSNDLDMTTPEKVNKQYSTVFEDWTTRVWKKPRFSSYVRRITLSDNSVVEQRFSTVNGFRDDAYNSVKSYRHKSDYIPSTMLNRLRKVNRALVLPIQTNITVITSSHDVVHSWFVPGLGIKMDCVPGRATHHTFFIEKAGVYYGQCAEICGRYHHHMPIRVCAIPFEHFLLWWKHYGLKTMRKTLYKSGAKSTR